MGNFKMVLLVLIKAEIFKMALLVPIQIRSSRMVLLVPKQMENFQMVLPVPRKIGSSRWVRVVLNQIEIVCVHQVRAGSSFVQLTVGSIDINARIDSGAEIIILSSKIYEKLSKAPAQVKEVDLQMADNDSVMKGFIIQPLKMRLGNQCFNERVYVASIGDDMLLGHDLLHHLGVCLNL